MRENLTEQPIKTSYDAFKSSILDKIKHYTQTHVVSTLDQRAIDAIQDHCAREIICGAWLRENLKLILKNVYGVSRYWYDLPKQLRALRHKPEFSKNALELGDRSRPINQPQVDEKMHQSEDKMPDLQARYTQLEAKCRVIEQQNAQLLSKNRDQEDRIKTLHTQYKELQKCYACLERRNERVERLRMQAIDNFTVLADHLKEIKQQECVNQNNAASSPMFFKPNSRRDDLLNQIEMISRIKQRTLR